ncbi:hypothetical protein LSPH26S_03837 [Lysinibacillus sphaericus]
MYLYHAHLALTHLRRSRAQPDHSFARLRFQPGRDQGQRAGRAGRVAGLAYAAAGLSHRRCARPCRFGGAADRASARHHRVAAGAAGAGRLQHGRVRFRPGLAGCAGGRPAAAGHAGDCRLRAQVRPARRRTRAADPRLARRGLPAGRRARVHGAAPAVAVAGR